MTNQYKMQDAKLTGRNQQSRKIDNNTYLQRRNDDIVIKLHDTDIITYRPNGDTILNSGGWRTNTTKERINSNLDNDYRLIQDKSIWYLVKYHSTNNYRDLIKSGFRFKDNITIKSNGKIINFESVNSTKKDTKIKAKVKAYAKLCANKLPLDLPSGGDCWYCYMQTQDGKSLGDAFKNSEHLLSHIKENYVVPSLVYNALKERYNAPLIMTTAFTKDNKCNNFMAITKEYTAKAIYKYILSRLNYAV